VRKANDKLLDNSSSDMSTHQFASFIPLEELSLFDSIIIFKKLTMSLLE